MAIKLPVIRFENADFSNKHMAEDWVYIDIRLTISSNSVYVFAHGQQYSNETLLLWRCL